MFIKQTSAFVIHPFAFTDCKCNKGVKDGKGCDDTGKCFCQKNFSGDKCNSCATGYYDFQNNCLGI